AMADLVAILDARGPDYARAQAQLDTSGENMEQSFAKLLRIVHQMLGPALGDHRAAAGEGAGSLARAAFSKWPPRGPEYRMIGPRPDDAPTIVMLHEGLGSVGLWGPFPDKIATATGAGVFAYSRAGYGNSTGAKLPRSTSFMDEEAREVLPRVLAAIGF